MLHTNTLDCAMSTSKAKIEKSRMMLDKFIKEAREMQSPIDYKKQAETKRRNGFGWRSA